MHQELKWKRIDKGKKYSIKAKNGKSGMKTIYHEKERTQGKIECRVYINN